MGFNLGISIRLYEFHRIRRISMCSGCGTDACGTKYCLFRGFLQLSNDGSGKDDGGMDDDTKVLTIFLLNLIGCILCCGVVQGVIMLSKRMNAELISLRKNYKQYKELARYREFRKAYTQEKEALATETEKENS
jgi:hypothetical protein